MKVNGMEYDDTHIAMFLEKLFWCAGEGPQATQNLLERLAYGDNVVIANEFHEETLNQVSELKTSLKNRISKEHDLKKSLKSAQNDNYTQLKELKVLSLECDSYATQIAEYERISGLVGLWKKRPKKDTFTDADGFWENDVEDDEDSAREDDDGDVLDLDYEDEDDYEEEELEW